MFCKYSVYGGGLNSVTNSTLKYTFLRPFVGGYFMMVDVS